MSKHKSEDYKSINKIIIYTLCNGQTLNIYFLTFICLILNLQGCKYVI